MNSALSILLGMHDGDAEDTVATVVLVHVCETDGASNEAQRIMFSSLSSATVYHARRVIGEFSNKEGMFNLDHVAWQLGIDTTAEGPMIEAPTGDGDDVHVCVEENMIYDGHYGAPGRGMAMHCKICNKRWAKIGDTFYEESIGAHILNPDDVR